MKLRAALWLLLLFLSFQLQALSVFVGHTVFHAPKGERLAPYLSLYWEIDATTLHFENKGNGWVSEIQVEVSILSDTGVFSGDHFIIQTPSAASPELAMRQAILHTRNYALPYGNVVMKIDLAEVANGTNRFSQTDTLVIQNSPSSFMSGLQILDTAYSSNIETPFQRNGKQHIPIAIPFIDNYRNSLNYYFEIYDLDRLKNVQPYVLKTFISKKVNENALVKYIKTDTIRPGGIVPVYGSFPIQELSSGNYYLNASVFDNNNERLAHSSIFFQRAQKPVETKDGRKIADNDTGRVSITDTIPVKETVTLNLNKTFVGSYTPAQVKAILKMLLPIADPVETQNINNFISKPDDMYSRYFIYNFWLNKNPDKPEKSWAEYADKVREVNKLFGGGAVPGYETDRGYTYLKYGKPNERIIVTNEQGALPYEIWQYFSVKTQGRDGVFLFYRPENMVNDYRVLHTTVTGEARNMNWRQILYPNGKTGVMGSQAEQYLRNR